MVPCSTTHFSAPLFIQPIKSFPLNNGTHTSSGRACALETSDRSSTTARRAPIPFTLISPLSFPHLVCSVEKKIYHNTHTGETGLSGTAVPPPKTGRSTRALARPAAPDGLVRLPTMSAFNHAPGLFLCVLKLRRLFP